MDITLIASLHAQMSFAHLIGREGGVIPPLEFNWLIMGIRPQPGTGLDARFKPSRRLLRPLTGCHLLCDTIS